MSTGAGRFVWCELMTADTERAAAFYGNVVGWQPQAAGPLHPHYTMLQAGDAAVGGVMPLPEAVRAAGGTPGWMNYIGVDDVEAMSARVREAGGAVHRDPDDIPEVGRFAVVSDPQGAVFTLFQPRPGASPPPVSPMTPGHVGWHELHAADWQAAFEFYAGLFGWTRGQAIDMGPIGTYQIFAEAGAQHGEMLGGMMNKGAAVPKPMWLAYFVVDAADLAVERLKAAGGQLLNGPVEVPGGSWIVQGRDPEGVVFAVVAPRR